MYTQYPKTSSCNIKQISACLNMPGHTQLKFLKSISYFLKYLSTYQISGRPFKSQLAFTCSKSKIETLQQVVKSVSLVESILGYNLGIKIFLVGFVQNITALFQFNFSSCPEKTNDKIFQIVSQIWFLYAGNFGV